MRTAAILLLSAHGASPLRPLPLLRRAISRARTPSLAEQPPEVGVDTDGDGVADSIALDTVGDGFADTLVPLAAEDTWRRRAQELLTSPRLPGLLPHPHDRAPRHLRRRPGHLAARRPRRALRRGGRVRAARRRVRLAMVCSQLQAGLPPHADHGRRSAQHPALGPDHRPVALRRAAGALGAAAAPRHADPPPLAPLLEGDVHQAGAGAPREQHGGRGVGGDARRLSRRLHRGRRRPHRSRPHLRGRARDQPGLLHVWRRHLLRDHDAHDGGLRRPRADDGDRKAHRGGRDARRRHLHPVRGHAALWRARRREGRAAAGAAADDEGASRGAAGAARRGVGERQGVRREAPRDPGRFV